MVVDGKQRQRGSDRQRGESGAAADVQQTQGRLARLGARQVFGADRFGTEKRVNDVLLKNVVRVGDGGQIELRVVLDQFIDNHFK